MKITSFFFFLRLLVWCLLGFGCYLLVAWGSYHPFDMSYSSANLDDRVQNIAGYYGAWLIDVFFTFLGQIGNFIPFVFCLAPLLWLLYAKSAPKSFWSPIRWIIGIILLLCSLTSLATILSQSENNADLYSSGGVLGEYLRVQAINFGITDNIFFTLIFITLLCGFLLCKGLAFCKIVSNVYYWVMLKPTREIETDKDITQTSADTFLDEENEKNFSHLLPELEAENTANELEKTKEYDNVDEQTLQRTMLKIYGLTPDLVKERSKTDIFKPKTEVSNSSEEEKEFLDITDIWQPIEVNVSDEVIPKKLVSSEVQEIPVIKMTQKEEQDNKVKSHQYSTTTLSPEVLQAQLAMRQRIQAQRVLAKFGRFPNQASQELALSMSEDKIKSQSLQSQPVFTEVCPKEELDLQTAITSEPQQLPMPSSSSRLHIQLNDIPGVTGLIKDNSLQSMPKPTVQNNLETAILSTNELHIEHLKSKVDEYHTSVNVENKIEHQSESVSKVKSDLPQYQVYGDSLIHPALQKRAEILEKPTTPLPMIELLDKHPSATQNITEMALQQTSARIEHLLKDFGVKATVEEVLVGPVVTRYELALQPGVKASKITSIESDLARALLFPAIRVAEVIPGKPYVGIETPNSERQTVYLRDVLDSDEFRYAKSPLSMALGKDISGRPVVVDLASMPHLLVAGATGSGKSVGVNTMILSLLFKVKPEEVKFIMIDPKVVELSVYNGIPHLLTEVVTDMKKASNALRWCVDEMERRYQLLAVLSVRNIEGYNEQIEKYEKLNMPIPNPLWKPGDTMDKMPPPLEKLPYIVVIVDEFADLMMMVGKQVEELIARLAQKARAIGIHLILATQRPSVDVITGLIKANIPTRIAFSVASKIDSRTILDQGGAEALLGRGDMLYAGKNALELIRVHGAYMTDEEVVRVANDWRARGKPNYIDGILDYVDEDEESSTYHFEDMSELDELFDEVADFVINTGTTSVSSLQRRFRIGFNRAARIMEQLEEQGIVSSAQNGGKREILGRPTDY